MMIEYRDLGNTLECQSTFQVFNFVKTLTLLATRF